MQINPFWAIILLSGLDWPIEINVQMDKKRTQDVFFDKS